MKKSNIVLIGFMGSGKTSVGRLLAKKLKLKFYETDSVVEKKAGMKIKNIFEKYGEKYFRIIESSVAEEIIRKKTSIISTGGGIIKRPGNIKKLNKNGIIIYLKANFNTVVKRLSGCRNRPLFNEKDIEKTRMLFNSRVGTYQKSADIIITTDKGNVYKVTNKILKKLKRRKDWILSK